MTDHWQDNSIINAQVINDDDAPEDWESAFQEKHKTSEAEEKPKASSTTKTKVGKNKHGNNEESDKIIKQPDGNYTPEELDRIKITEELKEEQEKFNMASELLDKDGKLRSLDDMDLYTKDEFLNYSLRLSHQLALVSDSKFFPDFVEHFLNGVTQPMSTEMIRRLSATLQAITIRKESEKRERIAKSKTKKQNKPQLRTGRQSDFGAFGDEGGHDYEQDNDYDGEDFI